MRIVTKYFKVEKGQTVKGISYLTVKISTIYRVKKGFLVVSTLELYNPITPGVVGLLGLQESLAAIHRTMPESEIFVFIYQIIYGHIFPKICIHKAKWIQFC